MTPEEILDKYCYILDEWITEIGQVSRVESQLEDVVAAMKEFGKLAFEAGKEKLASEELYGSLSHKYETYEDYLKELYGEAAKKT